MSTQQSTNTNSNFSPVPASSSVNSVNGITNFNINNNNSAHNNNNNINKIPSTSGPIQNPATQASQFAFGNYLNNFTDIPDILNVATQNIRGGLSHLSKQLAILEIMSQPFKDSQYIDILGFSHTGITAKQSKHVFTYDVFSNYKPFFLTPLAEVLELVFSSLTILQLSFKKLVNFLVGSSTLISSPKITPNCA